MAVPLLDLAAQHRALLPEMSQLFEEIVRSGQFILGPRTERFEKDLAAYCGVEHAVALSSGTDALLAALMALGIGPGDEVIVPPFTFFASAGCVARLGATPVFVDIEPQTFNIDPAKIERALTKRTKAIMPVHLFGQCAEMAPIMAVAQKRGLKVVEDAAQAIGAKDGATRAGAIGGVGCLSFYPSKNLSALGDGGACVLHDGALAERLRVLRLHGMKPKYYHEYIGGNFRLDAIQCAMLGLKLPYLDAWAAKRREHACQYGGLLQGLPITVPTVAPGKFHVFNQYTIRVPGGKRDALRAHLSAKGIGHDVYYPLCLHQQKCFAYLGNQAGDFPVSEQAAAEVISLPIYPELTEAQQKEVAEAVRTFFG